MTNPIYIIGNNPLAQYLGYQLQNNGQDVIILLDHFSFPNPPDYIAVSVKDERNLSQQQTQIKTSLLMTEKAEMVIITSYADELNTAVSSLSTGKIQDAPVICFTPLKDISYLYPITSPNLYQAFFNGYISSRKDTISLSGRKPEIILCSPADKKIDPDTVHILNSAKIHISISNNQLLSFWQYIIPYALCSIWSASEDCKISTLLSDKTNNQLLHTLINEFCMLSDSDKIKIDVNYITKKIYNIPTNYIYPLHQAIASGKRTEFDFLTTIIEKSAVSQEINIPQTYRLLKKLYNLVLYPTL